jgi:hypothetical protein
VGDGIPTHICDDVGDARPYPFNLGWDSVTHIWDDVGWDFDDDENPPAPEAPGKFWGFGPPPGAKSLRKSALLGRLRRPRNAIGERACEIWTARLRSLGCAHVRIELRASD